MSIQQYTVALAQERQLTAELKKTIDDLKKTVATLEENSKKQNEQLQQLQNNKASRPYRKEDFIPTNSDEEDIVAKETGWILQKTKKRKLQYSPTKSTPENIKNDTQKRALAPPPIIVSDCSDYSKLSKELGDKTGYKSKILNNNQIKINAKDETQYRELTKAMNEQKVQWHSFDNKQTRPIRVMAKDVHPSYSPEEIKEDLKAQGLKITEVTNKLKIKRAMGKVVSSIKLPMFMLTFETDEDINKIFEIQYICNMKVRIEALKTSKLIPQCKKCQRFGHTQKFCHRDAVCVKCAGNHPTASCKKLLDQPPKCSNCGESHPANYRGCVIAKELQKRRNLERKPKLTTTGPREFVSKTTSKDFSYAQAANSKANRQDCDSTIGPGIESILKALNEITTRLDRLENAKSTASLKR
jgi:hypothetical protein